MSTTLENKPVSELIELYNKMAVGTTSAQIGSWKQAKAGLINRIIGLGYREQSYDITGTASVQVEEVPVDLADPTVGSVEDLKPKKEPKAKAEPKPKKPKAEKSDEPVRTIKQASLELMCVVDFYENKTTGERDDGPNYTNARSVGLSYTEILRRLADEFPDAKTSVACLRWYAVKVRAGERYYEGYQLPQRRPQERAK